jgi:hypothetical protein
MQDPLREKVVGTRMIQALQESASSFQRLLDEARHQISHFAPVN